VIKQNKLLVSLAVSMALYGTNLAAEEAQAEEEESNVVIVTAQKRSERVTEVPIAISVFPQETIDQTGIQELREIGDFIPNMTVTQGTDFGSKILIRGVGANSRNIGFDSRVGVYLDGVYLGQGPAVNQDLIDLERVEVLRGPQGTLFGKNTVAGAVSLVSKKPSGDFEGKATIGVGNFDAVEMKFSVDIPISDSISAKLSASARERDGFIDNVYEFGQLPTTLNTVAGGVPIFGIALPFPIEGDEVSDTSEKLLNQDTQSYRAQLRIQPNDKLDINIAFDGIESDRLTTNSVPLTTAFGDTLNHFADYQNNEVNWNFTGGETRDITGGNITIDYDFGNEYAFRSITAVRDTKIHYQNDLDYSPIDFITLNYTDSYEQTTQEFQLISPDDAAFKYVIGYYYFLQDSDTFREVPTGSAGNFFGADSNRPTTSQGSVETTSNALYISGSYDFNEQWKLGFGMRYSEETKDVNWNLDGGGSGVFSIGCTGGLGCFDGTGTPFPVSSIGNLVDSRTDTQTSPTVSLNYAISDITNTYVKYSTGFKSGGFNLDYITQAGVDAGVAFDEETVTSYELGLKTNLLDERLLVSIAYFDAQYEDYQVNQFVDLGFDEETQTQLTSITITNAAEVDTSGLEFEANYKVTDSLTINGSFGILDATFSDFPDGTTETITADDVQVGEVVGETRRINAKGNRLPWASEFNASLGVQYYSSLNSLKSDLLLRLDITHDGDYFTGIENESTKVLPGNHPLTFALDFPHSAAAGNPPVTINWGHTEATTIVNARVGLISQEGDWEVFLWGRNLSDEDEKVESVRDFFGTLGYLPRQPRTYGVEAVYNF